ncbi:MAG: hypothetical protein A4E57_03649 [Syntrophorhabdaceae bacterium PtaU1.Bin034]|jgi:hypothetical protein|nr:MAG: hypothetical protein A4E57_03649 [Syntrophorhabdaceae bacterium PtaU1.Bin034]
MVVFVYIQVRCLIYSEQNNKTGGIIVKKLNFVMVAAMILALGMFATSYAGDKPQISDLEVKSENGFKPAPRI